MPLTAGLHKEPIDILFVLLGTHKKDALSPTLGLGFNFLPNEFTFKRVSRDLFYEVTVKKPLKEKLWKWMPFAICRPVKLRQWNEVL